VANALEVKVALIRLSINALSPNPLSQAALSRMANALEVKVALIRPPINALSLKLTAAPCPVMVKHALVVQAALIRLSINALSLKAAHGLMVPAVVMPVAMLTRQLRPASECENGSVPD